MIDDDEKHRFKGGETRLAEGQGEDLGRESNRLPDAAQIRSLGESISHQAASQLHLDRKGHQAPVQDRRGPDQCRCQGKDGAEVNRQERELEAK